jgi:hypothetical protein
MSLSVLDVLSFLGLAFSRGPTHLAMLPVIDSMNHNPNVTSNVCLVPLQRRFELSVDQVVLPGDQVFISYGNKSNNELLLFFGFVVLNNLADNWQFSYELDEWFDEQPVARTRISELMSTARVSFASSDIMLEQAEDRSTVQLVLGRRGQFASLEQLALMRYATAEQRDIDRLTVRADSSLRTVLTSRIVDVAGAWPRSPWALARTALDCVGNVAEGFNCSLNTARPE